MGNKNQHTSSISSITISQHANLHIGKERGVSAQTSDIRLGASTVGEIIFEARLRASREGGEILC